MLIIHSYLTKTTKFMKIIFVLIIEILKKLKFLSSLLIIFDVIWTIFTISTYYFLLINLTHNLTLILSLLYCHQVANLPWSTYNAQSMIARQSFECQRMSTTLCVDYVKRWKLTYQILVELVIFYREILIIIIKNRLIYTLF